MRHASWGTLSPRVQNHCEHYPLNSRASKDYMSRLYFLAEGRAPNATALQDALTTLSGFARFEGAEHEVHMRVAGHQERMYLDLCDTKWRGIEIGVDGWQGQLAGPVHQPPGGHQPAEAKAGQ